MKVWVVMVDDLYAGMDGCGSFHRSLFGVFADRDAAKDAMMKASLYLNEEWTESTFDGSLSYRDKFFDIEISPEEVK